MPFIVSAQKWACFLCFCILGTLVLWSRSVLSQHIRGTPGAVSATWHESSHASTVYWACWNGIRLNSRLTWCRLDFLRSCSNLMSHGGIQMGQTQIWQQRLPKANHVKGRMGCQVGPPSSIFPSFKLSVSLMVALITLLFNSLIRKSSQLSLHSLCPRK